MVSTIIFGVLGVGLGLMLAFFHEIILSLIFVIFGILTLLSGIPQLVSAIRNIGTHSAEAIFDLIMSILTVAVGVALIFFRNSIIMLVVGIYLIVFPIIRVVISKKKLGQLRAELPSVILGIVLVVLGPFAQDVVFKILGAIVVVLSVLYTVFGIIAVIKLRRIEKNTVVGTRLFVDVNGDGSVDSVFVDTDGDGRHDSTIYIDNSKQDK